MSQIFISITIDAISLIKKVPSGTWDFPQSLGSFDSSDVYVEMMTELSAVVNNQGKSELKINANVGDEIVFTITAPGAGQHYFPVLYDAHLQNNNVRSIGPNTAIWQNYCLESGGNGSKPTFGSVIPNTYAQAGQPNQFICSQWIFLANASGETQYDMSFAVLNTQTGEVAGYYKWDPFITINN